MRLELKYGLNPTQRPAYIELGEALEVVNGRPGYINFLDAINGWQLVRELKEATGREAAASFKHVSPAGVSIAKALSDIDRRVYFIPKREELSPLASAYARARGADRMSSFGDFIALSDECDESTARLISREVSDGVIAPSYSKEALELLKRKKSGAYTILRIDSSYSPEDEIEERTIFGFKFSERRDTSVINEETFSNIVSKNHSLPPSALIDLMVATIALRYTQSNSVIYSFEGQAIGIGAGQQSRLHCTRLAGSKADMWTLRHSEEVLELPFISGLSRNTKDNAIEQYLTAEPEIDIFSSWREYFTERPKSFPRTSQLEFLSKNRGRSLSSDAFFPFRDNIDRAYRSGVDYVAEPGGSVRDDDVIRASDEKDMVLSFTGQRLFHH